MMIAWAVNIYAVDWADRENLVREYDVDDPSVMTEAQRRVSFLLQVILGYFILLAIILVNLFVIAQIRQQAGCNASNKTSTEKDVERNETQLPLR